MNKAKLVFSFLAGFATLTSSSVQIDPARAKAAIMRRTGGLIERPGSAKGKVVFLNTQKRVDCSGMKELVTRLAKQISANLTFAEGEPVKLGNVTGALGEYGAQAMVIVCDNADCPLTLMVAPDQNFATVNVSALAKDGKNDVFVKARAEKEMLRAFAYLCGGIGSQYNNPIAGPVKRIDDLDEYQAELPPVDVLQRTTKYLPKIGVGVSTMTTYASACREGWAPAPTNDYQKAIWDKVHAPPTKPLKITYDKDKQKPVVK